MAQTIRRGGKGVRRVAAQRGAKAKVQTARKQTGSAIGHVMRVQPFSEETLHRILLTVILGTAAVAVWTVANIAGVPALMESEVARLSHGAGFDVKRVEVRGVKRMNEQTIYEKVLGQRDQAMSRVDVAGLRETLLDLPWVKDARVSRQLPDTLVVDVVERTPHGVLRKGDQLMLIDETGHELEPVSPARAKGMFVLSGDGAAARVPDLNHLLDAAPALKPLEFCLAVMPTSCKPSLSPALQSLMEPGSALADVFSEASLDVTSEEVASQISAALAAVPPNLYTEEDSIWLAEPAEAYYSRHGADSLQMKLPPPPPSMSKLRSVAAERVWIAACPLSATLSVVVRAATRRKSRSNATRLSARLGSQRQRARLLRRRSKRRRTR